MTNSLILRVHNRSQIFFSILKVCEDPDTFLLKNKQKTSELLPLFLN